MVIRNKEFYFSQIRTMVHFLWNLMTFPSTLKTVNFVWSTIISNTILLNQVVHPKKDNISE